MTQSTAPTVIKCKYSDVPAGKHAYVPDHSLEAAIKRFREWKRIKSRPVPEIVYETPIGFYFPLDEQA